LDTADIKERLKKKLDADSDTPVQLRPEISDDLAWELIRDAIPQIPQYRGSTQWFKIREEEFFPYYDPDEDEDVLSIDPNLFCNHSGVVVNDSLYLEEAPSSGYIETTRDFEQISIDRTREIKETDFNYERTIYYRTRYGGFVNMNDYYEDSTTYGETDDKYYLPKKHDGIFAIKVELVTEDTNDDQTVAIDISLDGGRTWLSSFMEIAADTEIDVSNYTSTYLVFKLTLSSTTATSPKVHSMRASIWAVKNLAENADYLVRLAYANYLERLRVRALYEGMVDAADNLERMIYSTRKEVAGYFDDKQIRPKETAPARFDGPPNRYAKNYFGG